MTTDLADPSDLMTELTTSLKRDQKAKVECPAGRTCHFTSFFLRQVQPEIWTTPSQATDSLQASVWLKHHPIPKLTYILIILYLYAAEPGRL